MKTISIIGIGRIGLPLALAFAEKGFKVYGIDIDKEHVEKIKKGEMPFIEEGANSLLKRQVGVKFFPTLDYECIRKSDYVILTLGTPVDEHLNPDYSQINRVLREIMGRLQKDQIIILRSTVSPGTTEYIKDYIEKNTDLRIGKNIFLSFCPERIAEGKALKELKEIPQIVGGIEKKSSIKAKELFENITKECLITDAKSAELAKIFTNMYRYVNFAIANEFMILAEEHERNIHEIVDLINKNYKRGGVKPPGYTAGPCLYKDGFFLVNTMPFNELISVSWKINETIPLYLIKRIKERINLKGKKVALLGMGFKANIDDIRNSLSFKIKKTLEREQCNLFIHDPFVRKYNTDIKKVLKHADVVMIGVNHDFYKKLTLNRVKKIVKKGCIICDIWNIFKTGEIIYEI
jgi:UDP-N-acetyl-D-mannosaminuronic acid dehydrogenase